MTQLTDQLYIPDFILRPTHVVLRVYEYQIIQVSDVPEVETKNVCSIM